MAKHNKEITSLVMRIQELVIQSDEITMYYQSKISFLSIYKFGDNGKYAYHRDLYLDGLILNESKLKKELKMIIKELEEMNNGITSESKFAI